MTSPRSAPDPDGPRPSTPTNPGLAVAVVARRLGVAPATLRTWDRRYGLGPSERTAGSHRRYTPEDVARLMVMRRLTLEGVAPVDAARAAVAADADELTGAGGRPGTGPGDPVGTRRALGGQEGPGRPSSPTPGDVPDGALADAAPAPDHPDTRPAAAREADAASDRETAPGTSAVAEPGTHGSGSRAGGYEDGLRDDRGDDLNDEQDDGPDPDVPAADGGRVVRPFLRAVPGASRDEAPVRPRPTSVSDVVDAAIAYDQRRCDQLLRIPAGGDPGAWWSELVEPALDRLAERTVLAGPGEVPEVVLANATLAALRGHAQEAEDAIVARGGPPRNHPSRMRKIVLVFAAPDEPLPLAAHALAAALGTHGAMVRIVTGPSNTHRTLELVTMVRPAAVAMVTTQTRPELAVVHATHEANPDLPVFVGLPSDEAASELPLAPTVHRVRSFTGLLHELLAVVR